MYIDNLLQFSGDVTASPITSQDLVNVTSAGKFSTNCIDLTRVMRDVGEGEDLFLAVSPTLTFTSATANATVEIQVLASPKPLDAGTTTVTATFTANATTDFITATAHGLTNGTRITVSTDDTLPAGLAANTSYYIINATTDTFQVSLTPGGTAVDITSTGAGSQTLTWYPVVIGSSGAMGLQRLSAPGSGTLFNTSTTSYVRINPALVGPNNPAHRYVLVKYVPSHTLTAGKVIASIVDSIQDGRRFYTSGFTVA